MPDTGSRYRDNAARSRWPPGRAPRSPAPRRGPGSPAVCVQRPRPPTPAWGPAPWATGHPRNHRLSARALSRSRPSTGRGPSRRSLVRHPHRRQWSRHAMGRRTFRWVWSGSRCCPCGLRCPTGRPSCRCRRRTRAGHRSPRSSGDARPLRGERRRVRSAGFRRSASSRRRSGPSPGSWRSERRDSTSADGCRGRAGVSATT